MLSWKKVQTRKGTGAPGIVPGDARDLASDKRYTIRTATPRLRIVGNLFIAVGLFMLLGIGGWYGYTEWSNRQFVEELAREFPTPTAQPSVANTATNSVTQAQPTAVTVPVALNRNPGDVGVRAMGIASGGPRAVDSSPPVRLALPAVGIDTEVVPVGWNMIPKPGGAVKAEWEVADYAVGHHKGSANPGQPGNVVMSGHVDYKGQVFKDLHKSNKGDPVIVYTEKGQYMYVITDMVLVLEEGASEEQKRQNARYMDPTPDQTLTMITCWPYGIDTHRLIVIAKPYQSDLTTQSEFSLR